MIDFGSSVLSLLFDTTDEDKVSVRINKQVVLVLRGLGTGANLKSMGFSLVIDRIITSAKKI
jgi:hypothetical protein